MPSFLKSLVKRWIVYLHRRVMAVVDDPMEQLKGRYGQGVRIERGGLFIATEGIHIGDWVYIGPNAHLNGSGGLWIGNNVSIAPNVTIYTSEHRYEGSSCIPYGPEEDCGEVRIRDHVWIGNSVIILAGVTVEEGAIVGAGSLVTKDVPRCAVVAGNPARVIKYRDEPSFSERLKNGRFYLREKQQNGRK